MSTDEKKIDRRSDTNALNVMLIEHLERLNLLQQEGLKSQKRDRFWTNVRHSAWLLFGIVSVAIYVTFALLFYSPGPEASPGDAYAAMVRMDGVISADDKLSAQRFIPALNQAFKDKKAKGVVLLINSPGGSPVQAGLIHDRLLELRQQYPGKKVITVAEDLLTSGAYMIATGTEDIYVHRDTIAGSIGVIMTGFGFDGVMHKFGVERRLFTAGIHKSFMDPFEPVQKIDAERARVLLDETHQHFIADVKESRGKRLKADDKTLFNGDFWVGEKVVALGLADGVSDLATTLKNVFHVEFTRDYTPTQSLFDRIQNRMPGVIQKAFGLDEVHNFSIE